jgi:hypothetical protein
MVELILIAMEEAIMDAVDLKWWSYSHSFGMEEGYYGCC